MGERRGMSTARKLQYVGVAGLMLSMYALYVEHAASETPGYRAACDVNSYISCSKVFLSEYGHLLSGLGVVEKGHPLDVANAALGIVYFSLVVAHPVFPPFVGYRTRAKLVYWLSIPCSLAAVFLAYILVVKLGDVCLVCLSTYVCMVAVLTLSRKAASSSSEDGHNSRKKK